MNIPEFKIGNVTVRFHGNPPSREVLEKACVQFLKGVQADGRKKEGDKNVMCKSIPTSTASA